MYLNVFWISILFLILLYSKTKDIIASAIFVVLNFINMQFALKINEIVFNDMLKINNPVLSNIFLFLFIGVISYSVGKILSQGTKNYRNTRNNLFLFRYSILFSFANIAMITGGIYIALVSYKSFKDDKGAFLNFLFIIICVVFIIISYKLYFNNFKKESEKQSVENEVKQIEEYASSLESALDDIRKFKHDYINVLSTFQGFIEEERYDELKDYFYNEVSTYSKELSSKNTRLALLGNIKIGPLKGIVSSKVLKADSEGIDVFIDIANIVDRVDIHILDLCRIIGILFDNAIEAAIETSEPEIQFGVVKNSDSVIFIIKNSCTENVPPVYKLFEKGFSTKGPNRGIGLSYIRDTIDNKYDNAILNTEIDYKSMWFIQELNIKYSEAYTNDNMDD